MARINSYSFGGCAGQTIGKLIDENQEAFLRGELNDKAIALIKQSLLIQKLALQAVAEDPVLGPDLDATLKY